MHKAEKKKHTAEKENIKQKRMHTAETPKMCVYKMLSLSALLTI